MSAVNYDEVVRMADTLTSKDQIRLLVHLHEVTTQHELSDDEWLLLFDSLQIKMPLHDPFPLTRDAWYDDER